MIEAQALVFSGPGSGNADMQINYANLGPVQFKELKSLMYETCGQVAVQQQPTMKNAEKMHKTNAEFRSPFPQELHTGKPVETRGILHFFCIFFAFSNGKLYELPRLQQKSNPA